MAGRVRRVRVCFCRSQSQQIRLELKAEPASWLVIEAFEAWQGGSRQQDA